MYYLCGRMLKNYLIYIPSSINTKLQNIKISNFFLVSDEGICPPEFKYVYDGGRKCCQFPYEDNDELNLLQFNSRQCQSNATLDCPFAEGCDDCEYYFINK